MKKQTRRRSRISEFIRMNSSDSEIQDEPLTTATAFSSISEHPDTAELQNLETLQQFNTMVIDLVWNDQPMGEQIVMEQRSETPAETPNAKRSLIVDMQTEIEAIPSYLTKRNESFQQLVHHAQAAMITTAAGDEEELRKVSILVYKIMIIQTYHLLWTTYLKSGRGQLLVPAVEERSVPIWPKELQAYCVHHSTGNQTSENDLYSSCVNMQLSELERQLKQCKVELNTKANNLHGYTLTVQKSIEAYIEQHLRPFRTGIEHRIELIHCDYSIRTLKLEFFRYHPKAHQIQLMKELCESKYKQETTEQEYILLQQNIAYHNSPSQSFESSPIAQSILIDSIQNVDMRRQLMNQYREVALQTRANLFHMYTQSAQDEREEYQKKYEDCLKKMGSAQRSTDDKQHIPLDMIDLISQRCEQISERIKCIYQFKAASASFEISRS